MKRTYFLLAFGRPLVQVGCTTSDDAADAYGNFEAIETRVSAQATGVLYQFAIDEGQLRQAVQAVGQIDTERGMKKKLWPLGSVKR